jgi:hypothetical protein
MIGNCFILLFYILYFKYFRNIQTTVDPLSPRYMKDTALGRLSNSTVNQQSNIPDLHVDNINTSTNFNGIDALPQSQTSSSIRSLSRVPAASNNIAILETFVEYRNLKRDYERASKQNDIWFADYKALTRQMKKLEQTTFRT